FGAVIVMALLAPVFAPHDPAMQYRDAFLVPPFWEDGGSLRFVLGTDAVGRDILSRLIFGSRYSLFVGVIGVSISLALGISIGLIAGYVRGALDDFVLRIMDVILSFPTLLLALVRVSVLGPGLVNAMIAIALVLQPHFVRLTRASVMAD